VFRCRVPVNLSEGKAKSHYHCQTDRANTKYERADGNDILSIDCKLTGRTSLVG
jgi:hypothetical protein